MNRLKRGGWPYRNFPNADFKLNRKSPQAKGLVGWWPPAGGYGLRTLRDYAGINNGTFVGAPTWHAIEELGPVVRYDGAADYTVLANATGVSGATTRTVACWVWLGDVNAPISTIFKYGLAAAGRAFGIHIGTLANGDIYVETSGGDWHTNGTVITTNRAYHIAVTYNGGAIEGAGSIKLYLDGLPLSVVLSGLETGVLDTGDTAPHIANDPNEAGREQLGFIGAVTLHNRNLDAHEIYNLWANPWELYQPITRRWAPSRSVAAAPNGNGDGDEGVVGLSALTGLSGLSAIMG